MLPKNNCIYLYYKKKKKEKKKKEYKEIRFSIIKCIEYDFVGLIIKQISSNNVVLWFLCCHLIKELKPTLQWNDHIVKATIRTTVSPYS